MKSYIRKHFLKLFIILTFASACALKQQVIKLEPIIIQPSELTLLEKNLTINTIDSRPMPQIIGIRYESKPSIFKKIPILYIQKLFKEPEVPYINNYENIPEKIRPIAEKYLKSQGFTIANNKTTIGKTLEITLQTLKYEAITKQKWYEMPHTKIKIYFTTKIQNEDGETTYKGQHEYTIEHVYPVFQPRSKTNEININAALSEGIRRIFDDQNLNEALKK